MVDANKRKNCLNCKYMWSDDSGEVGGYEPFNACDGRSFDNYWGSEKLEEDHAEKMQSLAYLKKSKRCCVLKNN